MHIISTLLLMLAMTVAATAQMPRTVPMHDVNGKPAGTATFSGNRIYLRDIDGKLFVQIVVDADGTRTMYDANGKQLDQIAGPKK